MAIATKAGLNALVALVDAIPIVQGSVNKGVPESFPSRVSAYVAVGVPNVERESFDGEIRMDATYYVGLGYAIDGAEETAEDDLADTIDAFIRAIEADPSIGGVFAELNYGPAGQAEYATVVGIEFRHVRFVIEGRQRETILHI